jgi:SAM-dependent methyltransferase
MTTDDFVPEPWDAFGRMLLARWNGEPDIVEIIERDDGMIDTAAGSHAYFASFEEWPEVEKVAVSYARGRVLDVGCGAGRVALYLQEQGCEVVGIDVSPLAVEVCRRRGVRDVRLLSITQTNSRLGQFDAIVMLGNNFGLFGNRRRARWLLRRWGGMTGSAGRIIAETLDPYQTDNPDHLSYHEWNRRRGRMGGQTRIRVRFRKSISPWFDYLFVSHDEMRDIVNGTGWRIGQTLGTDGPHYVAILEKTGQMTDPDVHGSAG